MAWLICQHLLMVRGENICLKPESADLLRLKNAAYEIFYKTGDKLYRVVYLEADGNMQPLKWSVNMQKDYLGRCGADL